MGIITVKKLDEYIFWCLCGFAAITCINHVIGNQILGIAVFLGIIRAAKERPGLNIPRPYRNALLCFFGVMLVSIFLSPDMVKSAKEFWRYVNRMAPFLLVFFFVKEKKSLLYILGAFLLSMFVNNIYAIYKGICLILQGETYLRVTGFDSMVIMFSAYLLMALPILAIFYFEAKKPFAILSAIIIFVIALFLNGTRAAWVILAAILPLIIFIYVRDVKKIVAVILLCIGVVVGMIYTFPFLQERMMSFSDRENISNRAHYLIARDSLEMIKDNPLVGIGLGRFEKVFNEKYRSAEHAELERGPVPHAHNNILTIWAEIGVFGCMAFCFMFGSFLYFSAKRWWQERNASDLMFFMVTLATVLHGLLDYSFGLNQAVKIYFCLLAIYLKYQIYEQAGLYEKTQ